MHLLTSRLAQQLSYLLDTPSTASLAKPSRTHHLVAYSGPDPAHTPVNWKFLE